MPTGIAEFDRVTGGGIVPGSALLIGGEPGIGKSTLLLAAGRQASRNAGRRALYFSGEEAAAQVRLQGRAPRPGARAAGAGLRDQPRQHPGDAGRRAGAPISSSSIRSRRCGPTGWRRPPAP